MILEYPRYPLEHGTSRKQEVELSHFLLLRMCRVMDLWHLGWKGWCGNMRGYLQIQDSFRETIGYVHFGGMILIVHDSSHFCMSYSPFWGSVPLFCVFEMLQRMLFNCYSHLQLEVYNGLYRFVRSSQCPMFSDFPWFPPFGAPFFRSHGSKQ